MTDEYLQKLKDYVAATQPIVKAAAEREEAVESELGPTVDAWIKAGMLEPTKRDAAMQRLRDPSFALQSLRKVAEQHLETAKEASPRKLGEGVQVSPSPASEESADAVYDRAFGVIRSNG